MARSAALSLHPADFWLNFDLGVALALEKESEAAGYFRVCLAIRPNTPAVYNNLGSVYARQGNTAKAMELFRQAIELDSSYSDPYYNLGSAYEDRGEKAKGLGYKKAAARLG